MGWGWFDSVVDVARDAVAASAAAVAWAAEAVVDTVAAVVDIVASGIVVITAVTTIYMVFSVVYAAVDDYSAVNEILPDLPTIADMRQFPYHAVIEYNQTYLCSGALISAQVVLTLASCVVQAVKLKVETKLDIFVNSPMVPSQNRYTYNPISIVLHAGYNSDDPNSIANNVAVIRLNKVVLLTDMVNYVNVPKKLKIKEGYEMAVSGYSTHGSLPIGNSISLRGLKMRATDDKTCNTVLPGTPGIFCMVPAPRYPPCISSLGSPAVNHEKFIVGLSIAVSGCNRGNPEVFLDVQRFAEFIIDAKNKDASQDDTTTTTTTSKSNNNTEPPSKSDPVG